jgi:hypothetical protein
MRTASVLLPLLLAFSSTAGAADFCDGSRFVTLDQVLSHPNDFLQKRIQLRALLRTDAKEFTRLSLDENSRFSVLTTVDEVAGSYNKSHNLSATQSVNVVDDLYDKLRIVEGAKFVQDRTKIRYYRQDVNVCGRLVRTGDGVRFVIDDLHVEKSYLLPFKTVETKR